MKRTFQVPALLLSAAMLASLAGCGAAQSTAAESAEPTAQTEATAEPTATPAPTVEPTATPEPTAAPATEHADPVWCNTHNYADFTLDELAYVNSALYQLQPGDGKAFCQNMQQYDPLMSEDGIPQKGRQDTPYYDASLYTWFDADGTMNWYRDGKGTVGSTVAVANPESGCGRTWAVRTDGSKYLGYYPTAYGRQTMVEKDAGNPFVSEYSKVFAGPSQYTEKPDSDFYQQYKDYLQGVTYEASLSKDSGATMAVYVNDDMWLVSMMENTMWGMLSFYSQEVQDTQPDTSAVTGQFNDGDFVECTVIADGETYTMPMSTADFNYFGLYNSDAVITASEEVEVFDGDGVSQGMSTQLSDWQDFKLTGPVTFTVE